MGYCFVLHTTQVFFKKTKEKENYQMAIFSSLRQVIFPLLRVKSQVALFPGGRWQSLVSVALEFAAITGKHQLLHGYFSCVRTINHLLLLGPCAHSPYEPNVNIYTSFSGFAHFFLQSLWPWCSKSNVGKARREELCYRHTLSSFAAELLGYQVAR